MKRFLAGLALLSAGFVPIHTRAAEPPSAAKAVIAPEAEAAVARLDAFYRAAKSVKVEIRADVVQDIPGAPTSNQSITASFAIARPNLLALKIDDSSEGEISVVCDGRTVWTYLPALKQYTVADAPQTLEPLLRDHELLTEIMAITGPTIELLRDRPKEVMLKNVTLLATAGKEAIAEVEYEKVRGEQDDMDWTAWIQTGERPTLGKYVFSPLKGMLAAAPAETKEKLKNAKLEVTVKYSNWQFDAALPAETFAFFPPEGSRKVARFGPMEEDSILSPVAKALKGKPAPDVQIPMLDGGKMQIANHKGKQVVLLDFWASWCAPCVITLPIIHQIADALKDKGLVVYAINQQEEINVVKAFLQKEKLHLNTALDPDLAAHQAYGVTGLPHTVLIDKEGNVAFVSAGTGQQVIETLLAEIQKLLAK